MEFIYQAKTKGGKVHSGTIEASSEEAALALLQKYNLFVISLEKVKEKPFYKRPIRVFERITKKDIALFSRQMAIMLGSGVTVSETLGVLARQTKKQTLKEVISKVAKEVEGGTAFSKAISAFPNFFSPLFIAMIKSGEISGRLSESIEYLAGHFEREYDFYSKVKGALTYPAFIFFVFLVIGAVMIFLILPRLSEILGEIGQLPSITKFVLSLADFLRKWGLILLLIFFALFGIVLRSYRTKEGKKFFDRFFLKIPLLGDFLKKIYLSRLSENLSVLISAGVPISKALEIVAEIVGNDVYQKRILETRDRVRRGEPMSLTFQRHPKLFPPLFSQMTSVGERAGKVDLAFKNVSLFFRKEVDMGLETLVSLLEPLMIVFLGFLVGGLVISFLIPIYRFRI